VTILKLKSVFYGCDFVQYGRSLPTFQSNLLPPFPEFSFNKVTPLGEISEWFILVHVLIAVRQFFPLQTDCPRARNGYTSDSYVRRATSAVRCLTSAQTCSGGCTWLPCGRRPSTQSITTHSKLASLVQLIHCFGQIPFPASEFKHSITSENRTN
jgi:hypothetical protein